MSEIAEGSLAFLAVALTALSAWVQMLGGRPNGRVFYRLVFPLVFSFSVIGISLISDNFRLSLLLLIPYYLIITHLGHHSFIKRLFECLMYGLGGVVCGMYFLLGIQLIICILAALIGHFCQDKKAPVIEMIVDFLRIALIGVMVI